MRSNLILSIFLTIVIANPVIRRANQAENGNGLVDLKADVADDEKVGKDVPVVGKELSDLELTQKIKSVLDAKKKAGKLTKDVEVSDVLKLVKEQISLKKATSITDGEFLSILNKVLGLEVKAEGEDLTVGAEAEAKEKASAEGSA